MTGDNSGMVNHPNRRRVQTGYVPTTAEIRQARESVGLTQTQAGEVIYCTLRGWQQWESGERPMHPAFWELWKLKTGA